MTTTTPQPPTPPAPEIRTTARCFADGTGVCAMRSESDGLFFQNNWFRNAGPTITRLVEVGFSELTPAAAIALIPSDWPEGREAMLNLFRECPVVDEAAESSSIEFVEFSDGTKRELKRILDEKTPPPAPQPFRITGPGVYRRRDGFSDIVERNVYGWWVTKSGYTYPDSGRLRSDHVEHGCDIVASIDEPSNEIGVLIEEIDDLKKQRDRLQDDFDAHRRQNWQLDQDAERWYEANKSGKWVPNEHYVGPEEFAALKAKAAKWDALDLSGVPDDCEFLGVRKAFDGDMGLDAFGRIKPAQAGCVWPIIRRITPTPPPDTAESLLADLIAGADVVELRKRAEAVLGAEVGR